MSKRKLKEAEVRTISKKLKDINDAPYAPVIQTNKQRTMVFCSYGVFGAHKRLMKDVRLLLPHSKRESKFDAGRFIREINSMCEVAGCNNYIFFDHQHGQLFMWIARVPYGPSAKFLISDIQTMEELKMTGNCLKGSRPFLLFDADFERAPHMKLLKELFIQVFGTPLGHLKSKPCVDHMLSFYSLGTRIWFRNYQVVEEDKGKKVTVALNEIGPRFSMELVAIFEGSFGGQVIYESPTYINPQMHRLEKRAGEAIETANELQDLENKKKRLAMSILPQEELDNERLFD